MRGCNLKKKHLHMSLFGVSPNTSNRFLEVIYTQKSRKYYHRQSNQTHNANVTIVLQQLLGITMLQHSGVWVSIKLS